MLRVGTATKDDLECALSTENENRFGCSRNLTEELQMLTIFPQIRVNFAN